MTRRSMATPSTPAAGQRFAVLTHANTDDNCVVFIHTRLAFLGIPEILEIEIYGAQGMHLRRFGAA